jgi:hypothetical protein
MNLRETTVRMRETFLASLHRLEISPDPYLFLTAALVKISAITDGIYMWVFTHQHSEHWHLSHTFVIQMGILHHSWLRVGCHPGASSLPADNMGS